MNREREKGLTLVGVLLAIAIIVIIALLVAQKGTDSLNNAQQTLGELEIKKDGTKELSEAATRLKESLDKYNSEDDDSVTCDDLNLQIAELKNKIAEAKLKGGISGGIAWLLEGKAKDLKAEIVKECDKENN
jgi:type II secretory pathway pseudopilin PulG